MTILEVIKSNSLFSSFSEEDLKQALVVRSLNGADSYNPVSHLKSVELVTADLCSRLAAINSFKEGDLSISYNAEVLEAMAKSIYKKYGEVAEEKSYKVIDVGVSFVK